MVKLSQISLPILKERLVYQKECGRKSIKDKSQERMTRKNVEADVSLKVQHLKMRHPLKSLWVKETIRRQQAIRQILPLSRPKIRRRDKRKNE